MLGVVSPRTLAAFTKRVFSSVEHLMARKKAIKNLGRSNPASNKSLAIRMVLSRMPAAKAAEVAARVKKEYGHDVSQNMIYMIKTKANMAADGQKREPKRGE